MGSVWLARDERLAEPVALKFLPPELAADDSALGDLRRETRRAHALSHPNIVRIHDLFEPSGESPFISMEFVAGKTLTSLRLVAPGRVLPWNQVAPIFRQLCDALNYAHDEQVIHRDIKPANLLIDSRGRLKLADFGISAGIADSMQRVTAGKPVTGTPAYMSPQQTQGRQPVVADDIYSAGATLYELLTSRPPFHRGDVRSQVILEEVEPPTRRLTALGVQNDIPPEVEGALMDCLAKEPDDRPHDATELAERLGVGLGMTLAGTKVKTYSIVEHLHPGKRRTQPGQGRYFWMTVAAATVLLAAGFEYFRPAADDPRPAAAPRQTPAEALPELTSHLPAALATADFTNSLGMGFIPIADTSVLFCQHETRVRDFAEFIRATGQRDPTNWVDWGVGEPRFGQTWHHPGFVQSPEHPVVFVNWRDAMDFCRWLTGAERDAGRLKPEQSYRLPTDEEWSRAAGLPPADGATPSERTRQRSDKPVFPWGNGNVPPDRTGNFADARSGLNQLLPRYEDLAARTAPVAAYNSNRFGLFDLGGNVAEWTFELDHPWGGVAVRGGGWTTANPDDLALQHIELLDEESRSPAVGFRVVLETTPGATARLKFPPAERAFNLKRRMFNGHNLAGWITTGTGWSVTNEVVEARLESGHPPLTARLPFGDWFNCHLEFYSFTDNPDDSLQWFEFTNSELEADGDVIRVPLTPAACRKAAPERLGEFNFGFQRGASNRCEFYFEGNRLMVTINKRIVLVREDGRISRNPASATGGFRLDAPDTGGSLTRIYSAYLRPFLRERETFVPEPIQFSEAPVGPEKWTNSLGMEFLPVKPLSGVRFSRWMTRVQDFRAFANATGYPLLASRFVPDTNLFSVAGQTWEEPGHTIGEKYPVVCVSWFCAKAFCRWLTQTERAQTRLPTNLCYRLPTSREWNHAAGLPPSGAPNVPDDEAATPEPVFTWGSGWPPVWDYANLNAYYDLYHYTSPVTRMRPGPFGLQDVNGNASEWTEDWAPGSPLARIVRGPNWSCGTAAEASILKIRELPPTRLFPFVGFRVVLAATTETSPAGDPGVGKASGEWETLFDGSPTEAWRGFDRMDFPTNQWRVDDGALSPALAANTPPLLSRATYANFELEFEWKAARVGGGGVSYHVSEMSTPRRQNGPTMALGSFADQYEQRNATTMMFGELEGLLVLLSGPGDSKNEWRNSRIAVRGQMAEHWVNGTRTLAYSLNSPALLNVIRQRPEEFSPTFLRHPEGHIALRHHGGRIWFRDIRVRRLPND